MTTVAHEGNPRTTPALTVSGTLDGGATLILQFPPLIAPSVTPPPPAAIGGTIITGSCPDVFAWNSDRADPFVEGWSTSVLDAMNYAGIDPDWDQYEHDTNLAVTISPTFDCYGVMYVPIPLAGSNNGQLVPLYGTLHEYSFLSLISGAPRAGICTFVQDPNRSPENITVVGVVTDWAAGTTGIYYWRNGSIGDLDRATSSQVSSYTPSAGDIYRIVRTWDSIDGNYAFGAIWNSTANSILWQHNDNVILPGNERNIFTCGLIAVGGGSSGQVLFGGNGATSYSSSDPLKVTAIYRQRNGLAPSS